jgi:hypothetical protein
VGLHSLLLQIVCFCENLGSASHTLLKGASEFLFVLSTVIAHFGWSSVYTQLLFDALGVFVKKVGAYKKAVNKNDIPIINKGLK